MTYSVSLTAKSRNVKTGPIPVSTTSAKTCPTSCPFAHANQGGCYAASGPLALHWRDVTAGKRGTDWATFCDDVASLPDNQLWRHNQAGDLPGDGERIDGDALAALVDANQGRRGFTYTHYPMADAGNRAVVSDANALGFTVNLSANSPAHADELAALAIAPVVTVLPSEIEGNQHLTTPEGRRIVVCPATYRDDVSCASCQLCQRRDRPTIVGFPAHGAAKRKADFVVSNDYSNSEM